MENKTRKRKPKIFLAISYTKIGKVENAITNFFRDKGFEVITGRRAATGEYIDKGVKEVIGGCDFGVVVYNELRHNITYEWGLLDGLGKKVFPIKDENVHINLGEEFSDKKGVKLTPFCGEDIEEEIRKSLMDDEGLTEAIEKAVGRSISESPEQPIVKEAAKVVVKSEIPLGTIPVKLKEIPKVDGVIKALSGIPNLTAEGYFYMGNAYHSTREYDKAIENFDQALKLNPNLAEAYNNRGNAYRHKGEFDKAIDDYNKALKLNPNDADAYNNRGIAYDDKGEYDKAIDDYNKALKLNPNLAEAYNNRGVTYRHKGEFDKAIDDYNKALKLNPNYADAYNNRGVAYRHKGEFDKAIDDYNKALKLNPNYADAYNNRGNAYADKGEYDKAIDDYNKALKLNPNDADAYNNRGNAYADKGEYDKAIDGYNKALKLNPNYAAAMANMGVVFMDKNDIKNARNWLNKALKRKNQLPDKGERILKRLKKLKP